jgi:uncharacterized membrane protein YgcG
VLSASGQLFEPVYQASQVSLTSVPPGIHQQLEPMTFTSTLQVPQMQPTMETPYSDLSGSMTTNPSTGMLVDISTVPLPSILNPQLQPKISPSGTFIGAARTATTLPVGTMGYSSSGPSGGGPSAGGQPSGSGGGGGSGGGRGGGPSGGQAAAAAAPVAAPAPQAMGLMGHPPSFFVGDRSDL